jgi:hypothetical protein
MTRQVVPAMVAGATYELRFAVGYRSDYAYALPATATLWTDQGGGAAEVAALDLTDVPVQPNPGGGGCVGCGGGGVPKSRVTEDDARIGAFVERSILYTATGADDGRPLNLRFVGTPSVANLRQATIEEVWFDNLRIRTDAAAGYEDTSADLDTGRANDDGSVFAPVADGSLELPVTNGLADLPWPSWGGASSFGCAANTWRPGQDSFALPLAAPADGEQALALRCAVLGGGNVEAYYFLVTSMVPGHTYSVRFAAGQPANTGGFGTLVSKFTAFNGASETEVRTLDLGAPPVGSFAEHEMTYTARPSDAGLQLLLRFEASTTTDAAWVAIDNVQLRVFGDGPDVVDSGAGTDVGP